MRVSPLGLAALAWGLPGLALPLSFGLAKLRESFPPQLELARCRELPPAGDDAPVDDPQPLADDEVLLGDALACPRDVVDQTGWRDVLAVAASESALVAFSTGAGLAGAGCAALAMRATGRSRHSEPEHRRAWRVAVAALVVWLAGAALALAGLLFVLAVAPLRG